MASKPPSPDPSGSGRGRFSQVREEVKYDRYSPYPVPGRSNPLDENVKSQRSSPTTDAYRAVVVAPFQIQFPAFYSPPSSPKSSTHGELPEASDVEMLDQDQVVPDLDAESVHAEGVEYWDPENSGSYPLRPKRMQLFRAVKRKYIKLENIVEEDDAAVVLPETEQWPQQKSHKFSFYDDVTGCRKTAFGLSIELFDNPDMDLLHPSADLTVAHSKGERGVPGRSRFFSKKTGFIWAPCLVLEYHSDKDTYLVEWISNKQQKIVKRLNVVLDREREDSFVARLLDAKEFRARMEAQMRFSEYIESLPFKNPELVNNELRTKLVDLSSRPLSNQFSKLVDDFMADLRHDYHNSVNKSIVDHRFKYFREERAKYMALQVFPGPGYEFPVPRQGCVPVPYAPDRTYFLIREDISKTLVVAQEAFLLALQAFFGDMDITSINLVTPLVDTQTRPWLLEEFRTVQTEHVKEIVDNFRNNWIPKVIAMIEELTPSHEEFLDGRKQELQALVRRLSMTMTEHLLEVVLQSLRRYRKLWCDYLVSSNWTPVIDRNALQNTVVQEEMTTEVAEVGVKEGTSFPDVTLKFFAIPMFKVFLKVDSDKFVFEPALASVEETVLGGLDAIVKAVTGLHELESRCTTLSSTYEEREMKVIPADAPVIVSIREFIQLVMLQNFVQPLELEDSFHIFKEVASTKIDEFMEAWKVKPHSLEEFEDEIMRQLRIAEDVMEKTDAEVNFRMLVVDCTAIRNELHEKAVSIAAQLMRQILQETSEKNEGICKQFSDIELKLQGPITNPEELDVMRKFVLSSKKEIVNHREGISQTEKVWAMLDRHMFDVPESERDLYWVTMGWPQRIGEVMYSTEEKLGVGKTKFMTQLTLDQLQLVKDLKALTAEIQEFTKLGDIELVEERMAAIFDIEEKLKRCSDRADLYNGREEIFELTPTEYLQVEVITKDFELYSTLWHTCADFLRILPQWMDGAFVIIKAEEMANNVEQWFKNAFKCVKLLTNDPKRVAEELKKKIEKFQVNIPFIVALRNPGMRDRHWKKLSDILGFEVALSPTFNVSHAVSLGLPKHIQVIDEVSEFASKEYAVERALDKMQGDWQGVRFEYAMWHNTGTAILRGLDDLQQMLEEQIIKTQSMQASPYVGPFEDRVKLWLAKLNMVQEVLDEWLNCQQQWLYLEPIFGSEDIMQQMPVEGRRFKGVDTTWRKTMEKLMKNPDALTVGSDEELLKNLREANKLLDMVQKGLNEYLETKRLAFPRFYFLSNDELLEILAETKDPLRVQPFLKKIFEGIHQLVFEPNLNVRAMMSEEGEQVDFIKFFNPKDAQGAVERWLTQATLDLQISKPDFQQNLHNRLGELNKAPVTEDAMRTSLTDVTRRAYEAYAITDRVQWISVWPGQVVLCASQMYWTQEVGESIRKGTLQVYEQKCTQQLQAIVGKVRGKLTKMERKTIGALIVIDVHARDVVKALADASLSDETDFDWISQLRYGYESEKVMVRMINAAILYAFEYLGNSTRLVITPLTDRCYRTLMGALHLNLGGAPEGPAGTGKTETTKDLAKAIAMQCVVFNCSDGLDYLAMGKFFKGLASSGAWSCFDEFNRIDLEVLSVIAQQILTIQRAKAAGLKSFEFEGVKLTLKMTCSVFITMNPGYAGRSELPDNLKALFRTVAMMVPDYALISEITLYSFGYLQARELARKLVATYRLCSEQLSSQNHYDYGMRAVISVLRAAGAVKQRYPDEEESVLMLKSLKDVNLPKFLAHDIPLFEGILLDLFPGTSLPKPDYDIMEKAVRQNCTKFNLQPTPVFLEKTFQLYEMILVRHGLMLVGYSYGAKTEAYRTLAAALTDMHSWGDPENITKYYVMNPKSIYIGQLYGQFDPISHEWTDGVLARLFRNAAIEQTPDRKWIIFDGPVDAVWIENMNTVLDDNKKLCLMSGEIIQMTQAMNLIFEVQDLAVASPATVSRCGMVYVEPSSMGWEPIRASWVTMVKQRYPGLQEGLPMVEVMIDWLIEPCLQMVKKHCKEGLQTSSINLAKSFFSLFESQLDEFKIAADSAARSSRLGPTIMPIPTGKDQETWIQCLLAMSVVWSVGALIDNEGRDKFDVFFRKLLAKEDELGYQLGAGMVVKKPNFLFNLPFPPLQSVYNFVFSKAECCWKAWIDTVDTRAPALDSAFNDIIVATVDTARYSSLLLLLVTHQKHVLFGGPTGTGKTVYIKNQLTSGLDKTLYRHVLMTFSAQTNSNQTQDIIDGKLDKRRKGVFGPPFGIKCVIFVDDLNMPALEVYGAQPPIEILRQWMDHGGWYDRAENTFRSLVDIQFVAAMGPPGGGRNPITPRFMRHFNILYINEFDDASLSTVFKMIVEWWTRRARLVPDVGSLATVLVGATIDIYRAIQKELLPTPAKSHYTYNLRDMSKVFQGVCMVGSVLEDKKALARLWCHECLRVFHDRLVDDLDRAWFVGYLKSRVETRLSMKPDYVFASPDEPMSIEDAIRGLSFGDLMDTTAWPKKYEEVHDAKKLLQVMEEGLADFNQQSKSPMNLVLFSYAAAHVLRIGRIIRQPFGNALLVGVGGGGRQSLTKLATFLAGFTLFQIEITKLYGILEWQEDLKAVLKKAGGDNPTVFLFSDTQLKKEQFLEDINNILNTGEVPNLYAKDEILGLHEMVRNKAKKAGRDSSAGELYMYFVDVCRRNLHLVICMSPFGSAFRTRLRMFPSLVNCCTIDWFSEWPQDGLRNVASKFLSNIPLEDPNIMVCLRDMCMLFHQDASDLSHTFFQEQRRHFYVTPTSYLELLKIYKSLLEQKREEVDTMRKRYSGGLEKLFEAESQVTVMKKELEALQPILIKTADETNALLRTIDKDKTAAEATRTLVEDEGKVASVKAKEAQEIKADCESELAVAMPMLEAALSALDTLTKADITEVKAMKNPPAAVKLVMEACCIMKQVKSRKIPDPNNPGQKMEDYWGPAQQMLADTGFLQSLKDFDKDNIPAAIIEKIRPYLLRDEFNPEVVKKASKAAYGLCCWIRAMESYDKVAKVVAPKTAKLNAATAEYQALEAALNEKKAILAQVEAKLAKLQEELNVMEAKKDKLEGEVLNCQRKLSRAEKLIGGLGGEKVRWTSVGVDLGKVYRDLTGDVLLSSGYIAYLGAVTLSYRERLLEKWRKICIEKEIPCSPNFKLATVLGSPVQIRDWVIDGLPNDNFSVDNGIIISAARRWPLIIDPQAQANKWIKNKEKSRNLQVMKLSDGDFVRKLENCISYGYPLLLENVMEELDPTLEPLLIKSLFKSAGVWQIRLGDNTIEYNEKFRFYITTKLRNPHYAPEVQVKVTLLNFMITPEGLEDQLLGMAVKHERPDLEEEKTQLVIQSAENQKQLKEIEDRIIEVLSSSEGNILENENAINIVSSSKILSIEIAEKQKVAEKTEIKIDVARKGYIPVAQHVGALFFTVSDLCNIDPMYQYSLTWYLNLFNSAMKDSEKSEVLSQRLSCLNDYFTYFLFCNVSRSLFEKDKLLLSFMICCTILGRQGLIPPDEFRFLIAGGVQIERDLPRNPTNWLGEKLWIEMILLSKLPAFQGFSDTFAAAPEKWRPIYDSLQPYKEPLPGDLNTKFSSFQKLLVLRVIRPDKIVGAVNAFVLEAMGQRYIEPPQFDLSSAYHDSSAQTPLIFILSAGSDPMAALLKFAEGLKHPVNSISLGQGQGPKAATMIEIALRSGDWVVLQNCHLAASWMPHLDRICEGLGDNINSGFRLWLTSYPSDRFPVAVLQSGIKMTNEPPRGLRANMLQSYINYPINDPKFFGLIQGERGAAWRKLLFGLCFFHASVQERVKYGPLGWNIPYQFSDPDLKISIRQLQSFLVEFPENIPFKALHYCTGECNYGGRVTDAHDRRTLLCLLTVLYNPFILDDGYRFSPSGFYYAPADGAYEDYIAHIKQFPLVASPEVLGLHDNADISKDQQETDLLLNSILTTQSNATAVGGRSQEEIIIDIAVDIARRIPPAFDIELARYKYAVRYEESMNSVLHQEMTRFNKLTDVIRTSLVTVQRTLKGFVAMSPEIEKLAASMAVGRLPAMWAAVSYPSMKPLTSYTEDLLERLRMLQKWFDDGPPPKFWISGFFFTHAFLTGVLQNYARKYRIPIDNVTFEFRCMPKGGNYNVAPEDGCYIHGMYIEGARWDEANQQLTESLPKQLFSPAPLIWLLPCESSKKAHNPSYSCPLYRTTERRGVLATTGHSSNFVFNVDMPSDKPQEFWVRRGVAMLLSLSD